MMSVEQILIREFHLRFPNTKSIAASVNADDGMSVNVDGKEWIMSPRGLAKRLYFARARRRSSFHFPTTGRRKFLPGKRSAIYVEIGMRQFEITRRY